MMKVWLLAVVVLTVAGTLFHVASGAKNLTQATGSRSASQRGISSAPVTLPLFFEPNQGQTASPVRFLARGSGYGLFLTSDEAVLSLQRHGANGKPVAGNVIRMRLEGANTSGRIRGAELLPGKTSYFIGNDPAKWHRDIPQFGRVEYQSVYPGIDLAYYGNQRQLEYDFRVAPGAEPSQIALSFSGASTHIESGDLVLSTSDGDVRFQAPYLYQQDGSTRKAVSGSFRQIADNRIGFAVGTYDRSRELVIDPLLTYSTYFGGSGDETLVRLAIDASQLIYLAGTTNSTDLPAAGGIQTGLAGTANIFIAKINPFSAGGAQLLYLTYLGGNGTDDLAGVAVDPNSGAPNIYVAGTTSSTNFPFTSNAFQQTATFGPNETTHGFVSKLAPGSTGYTLSYSSYLAGTTGTDSVTGLAVDSVQNAYLTGITTSTDPQSNGFPANANGFQRSSNSPGNNQFFASVVNTAGSGSPSMIYSTYFGGGNFGGNTPQVIGGGIAIDASGNFYFTGATNMLGVVGVNQEPQFPLFNAYQGCLNNACTVPDSSHTDAILVKINPSKTQPQAAPLLSTYMGGSLDDVGDAVAVDTSSNAYVTGSTASSGGGTDWNCIPSSCTIGLESTYGGGATDAFVAKVGNQTASGSVFPLNFFSYIGGSGDDTGEAIVVDSVGSAHVAGKTTGGLALFDPLLPPPYDGSVYGGGTSDAFVALLSTSTVTTGDYVTYLGGNLADDGTGIALDLNNTSYVAGTTSSSNFPLVNAYGGPFGGSDAFVTKLGAISGILVTAPSSSPNPKPVPAGTQATFTFDLKNISTDPAGNVQFEAVVPTTSIGSVPTATVNSGGGTCTAAQGSIILCNIGSLSVGATATVSVNVTPSIPVNLQNPFISVSGSAGANGSGLGAPVGQQDGIVDFSISASNSGQTVQAGNVASFPITLMPEPSYNATITMSESSSPSIVTAVSPTFTNPTVVLSGSGSGTTTLNIQTIARPVTTGSLFHRTSFYAAWLPLGGLSLMGLGIGVSGKRRRWMAGTLLALLVGLILLLPSCSSSSSAAAVNGGTAAGQYTITITGSASGQAAHNTVVILNVT
jgi:hypothetical protein